MSDKPETFAAIIADMRHRADNHRQDGWESVGEELDDLADRIERAVKRERDEARKARDEARETAEDALWELAELRERAPGNAAAMRTALNRVGHLAKDLRNITERDTEVRADVNEIVDVCRAALAAPARNCDVGTAEEQAHGFHAFCSDNTSEIEGMCNSTCPCIDCGDKCHCLCVWSQMPFVPAKGGRK